MTLSINEQDALDLELQREIQEACDVLPHSTGDERQMAKGHYLKLLEGLLSASFRT